MGFLLLLSLLYKLFLTTHLFNRPSKVVNAAVNISFYLLMCNKHITRMLVFSYCDLPDTGERKLYRMNEKCLKLIAENNSPHIPKG